MIIVLMGYMGSGKTSVGRHLSHILKYNFIDLDEYIQSKEEKSVSEIFKTKGEIFFRKKEAQYLNEILNNSEKIVLALGGGTPCYGNNLNLILNSEKSESIYLKASIPELVRRLLPEKNNRPLISHIKKRDELMEFLGKHLFERTPFYTKANFTILTDGKTIEKITEEMIFKLI